MPKTTTYKNASSGSRKSSVSGKDKTKQRRQAGNGNKTQGPSIIANSVFALTLKAKPGIEVEKKTGEDYNRRYLSHDNDDYEKMYADLRLAYINAMKLVNNETTAYDPLAAGLDIGICIWSIIQAFKRSIVPAGYELNIDKTATGEYFFTIWDSCAFDPYWHAFEIKPIIERLYKHNRRLHDLFIVFIKSFTQKCRINLWWNGGMNYAEEWLEEELMNWEENHDEEEEEEIFIKAFVDLDNYKHGTAFEYEQAITNTKALTPEQLLCRLKKFNQKDMIVGWMMAVCEFMKLPGNIYDFHYPEMEEEEEVGLVFEESVTVVWDWDDAYSNQQAEMLDSEAQGMGVAGPIINLGIMPYSKSIDLKALEELKKWPKKLHSLHVQQRIIIEKLIKDERKNRIDIKNI